LKLFPDTDHSLYVPARTGRKDADVRDELLFYAFPMYRAWPGTGRSFTGNMAMHWRQSTRLMSALEAGGDAGGQHGGQCSAALLVYDQEDYPYVDLRADEHREPIGELRRMFDIYRPQIPYCYERPLKPDRFPRRIDEWFEMTGRDAQGRPKAK
jgi:hypothetical protein